MSPLFKLGAKDLIRGLIVVVLAVLFSIPVEQLAKLIPFLHDPTIAMIVSVILGYLAKNLATDSEGKLAGKLQIK